MKLNGTLSDYDRAEKAKDYFFLIFEKDSGNKCELKRRGISVLHKKIFDIVDG